MLIQNVLVDDAVVKLFRLVDPSLDDTLIQLTGMLKPQVSHSFLSALEQDLHEVRHLCGNIREHRHKRVAVRCQTIRDKLRSRIKRCFPIKAGGNHHEAESFDRGYSSHGGFTGRAIKPIALRCVSDIASAVKIPVAGVGGVYEWRDALQLILMGASTVQVCTAVTHFGFRIVESCQVGRILLHKEQTLKIVKLHFDDRW